MNFQTKAEISDIALGTLKRISANRYSKPLKEIAEENRKKYDYKQFTFEDYSDDALIEKIKLESSVYNILSENLDEYELALFQEQLSEMYGCLKDVYQFVNILPETVGFKNVTSSSSEDELDAQGRKIVKDFFNKHYYNLPDSQKEKKYKPLVVSESIEIATNEGVDIAEAVQHAYKYTIINDFITKLSFPYVVESRINELLESEAYDEFFDKSNLLDSYENFKIKSKTVSRILSTSL